MEALVKPMNCEDFPSDQKMGFKLFRTPSIGWFMLSVMNMFLTQLVPKMIVRELSVEVRAYYRAPFKTIRSRKPVRQWLGTTC